MALDLDLFASGIAAGALSGESLRPRHVALLAWRASAGLMFGAGMSSLVGAAAAAAPSPQFGPVELILFGHHVPIMAALFGLIGLVLARRVAPVSPTAVRLGRMGNAALTTLLALGVLAFIIAGEKRPIVALSWAIGLGYSGLAFIELVSGIVLRFARTFIQVFFRMPASSADKASEEERP